MRPRTQGKLHADGPYEIRSTREGGSDKIDREIQDKWGNHICHIYCYGDQDDATASLFCAAPELLAALQACMAYIPGSEVHCWPPGHRLKADAMKLARAAIAKATNTKEATP